jgi:hypothetical protein
MIRAPHRHITTRAAGVGALVAGLLWLLRAWVQLADPIYWDPHSGIDYLAVVLYSSALAALTLPLAGLQRQQEAQAGRLGRWTFYATFWGAAAAGIGNLLEDGLGPTLVFARVGVLPYLLGFTFLFLGLAPFGIAILRAGVLARWIGVALILAVPLLLSNWERGGSAIFGLIWIAIGGYLLDRSRRSAPLAALALSARGSDL